VSCKYGILPETGFQQHPIGFILLSIRIRKPSIPGGLMAVVLPPNKARVSAALFPAHASKIHTATQ